jgi:hypothetical protein
MVRKDPLDAAKLAEALVELAEHLCKQLPVKDAPANAREKRQESHE